MFFILLEWQTWVWAAEQLLSRQVAFIKTERKLLSTACPEADLQVCSIIVFRYSKIYLKYLNQNVHFIMPDPIWTQDLGFTAKIHWLTFVQGWRCNLGWKAILLNPRHSSSLQDSVLFIWALPAETVRLAHQYVFLGAAFCRYRLKLQNPDAQPIGQTCKQM